MQIKFLTEYKSIKSKFETFEMADFSVLTGVNGSGKTHFLKAIKEGHIRADVFKVNEILYFSYSDFASSNLQTSATTLDKLSIWQGVINNSIWNNLLDKESNLSEFKGEIENLARIKNKPLLSLNEEDFNNLPLPLYTKFNSYREDAVNSFHSSDAMNDDILQSVSESIFRRSQFFLSSYTKEKFIEEFDQNVMGGRSMLTDLSKTFLSYYQRKCSNIINREQGKSFLTDAQFVEKYKEPPWKLIRNIFTNFNLHFDITDPESQRLDAYDSFMIEFINLDRDKTSVDFADLSSGEKILITLVNRLYSSNIRAELPKLILLDEVDAPLNPSAIHNFISYMQNNFTKGGIKVIIATHSATTVAYAPDDSIYIVNTSTHKCIRKVGKDRAMSILSEGFVTFSDLINFDKYKSAILLFSEGRNYKYLLKAKEYFGEDIDSDIINIISLSDGSLKILFDFIKELNSKKKFVFVWDSDYRIKSDNLDEPKERNFNKMIGSSNNSNRTYVFPVFEDGIRERGIENLFSKKCLEHYDGSVDKNNEHLERHIINRKKQEDFINFKDLFDFLKSDKVTNLV